MLITPPRLCPVVALLIPAACDSQGIDPSAFLCLLRGHMTGPFQACPLLKWSCPFPYRTRRPRQHIGCFGGVQWLSDGRRFQNSPLPPSFHCFCLFPQYFTPSTASHKLSRFLQLRLEEAFCIDGKRIIAVLTVLGNDFEAQQMAEDLDFARHSPRDSSHRGVNIKRLFFPFYSKFS